MKCSEVLFGLGLVGLFLLLLIIVQTPVLKTGDISFVGFNAKGKDSFSIKNDVDLAPHTIIQFTDSEWNGVQFGLDESNVIWDSGEERIPAGTVIHFSRQGNVPFVSIGKVNQAIKISKSNEAIFAYIGPQRTPTCFLAAISNKRAAYGTLKNTGLKEGVTAIILPRHQKKSQHKKKQVEYLEFSQKGQALIVYN